MFVHNVRYGFATNSSSTHSIVRLGTGVKVFDDQSFDSEYEHQESGHQEFGWDFFTCASEESKRRYLGQIVKNSLTDIIDIQNEDAAIIASNWVGIEVDPNGYIDHQSAITLPSKVQFGKYHIRKDFFDDLLAFILQPDIAILGGNDNDEDEHILIRNGAVTNLLQRYQWDDKKIGSPVLKLMLECNSKYLRARYDQTGKFWSLFSQRDGTKIRTSFLIESNAEKSEVPELVDIKITDYCSRNCYYCYQGSTSKGQHADTNLICQVSYALQKLETFEVALGGGEPTEHPNILEIIDYFSDLGIVVNLTTRNEDWIIKNISNIKDKIGAIGLSIESSCGLLDKLSKLRTAILNTNFQSKITVQVVVGTCSQDELQNIFEICKTFHLTVLLLGWKNTHRGRSSRAKARREEINLIELLDSFWGKPQGDYTPWNGPSVSFDTTIVNQMKEWLDIHGDEWTFTTREGAHSMYIDCVSETMHKSSYEETPGMSLTDCDEMEMSLHIKQYFATL